MFYVQLKQVYEPRFIHYCIIPTGSGKTITYIAPLISRLKDEEEFHGVITRLRRPRALIILPTRDLATQVLVSKL